MSNNPQQQQNASNQGQKVDPKVIFLLISDEKEERILRGHLLNKYPNVDDRRIRTDLALMTLRPEDKLVCVCRKEDPRTVTKEGKPDPSRWPVIESEPEHVEKHYRDDGNGGLSIDVNSLLRALGPKVIPATLRPYDGGDRGRMLRIRYA